MNMQVCEKLGLSYKNSANLNTIIDTLPSPCLAFVHHEVEGIEIASSNQVQRQQQRDEPVRENTHLVLDTLASRLRELSLDCRSF